MKPRGMKPTYHVKLASGKSYIEYELSRETRAETQLRRFCTTYTPETHWMAADHPLADMLPGAYALDLACVQRLNKALPGVVYDMPAVKNHLLELSATAFRDADSGKAYDARARIKQITCPVRLDRESVPITDHVLRIMHLVAVDFYTIRTVWKRETSEGVEGVEIEKAMRKAFPEIPPQWLERLCKPRARIIMLAAERTGELLGRASGRGLYKAWRASGRGDYFTRHPGAVEYIRARAAAVALPY